MSKKNTFKVARRKARVELRPYARLILVMYCYFTLISLAILTVLWVQ